MKAEEPLWPQHILFICSVGSATVMIVHGGYWATVFGVMFLIVLSWLNGWMVRNQKVQALIDYNNQTVDLWVKATREHREQFNDYVYATNLIIQQLQNSLTPSPPIDQDPTPAHQHEQRPPAPENGVEDAG